MPYHLIDDVFFILLDFSGLLFFYFLIRSVLRNGKAAARRAALQQRVLQLKKKLERYPDAS